MHSLPSLPSLPTVRDVRLLHADLSGTHMLEKLQKDLKKALWARCMVCYFNLDGFNALKYLPRALRDPRSQALFTLTCSCKLKAIEALADALSPPAERLKVFVPGDRWGGETARLLHSKMVFIVRKRSRGAPAGGPSHEAVLYVGSHNWTGPGLRCSSAGRYNVETSLRLVADWDLQQEPAWLNAVEQAVAQKTLLKNPFLDGLVQMRRCFQMVSCTDMAHRGAREELARWIETNCLNAADTAGATKVIVLTGVLGDEVDEKAAKSGQAPPPVAPLTLPSTGEHLYVQHYSQEGEPEVFDSSATWMILLWESEQALKQAEQPWLLLCNPRELGQEQRGNPSLTDIDWLIYDPKQNVPSKRAGTLGSKTPPQHVHVAQANLRSGRSLRVEYWSVAPVLQGIATNALNARKPDRHVLVEVIDVRRPAGSRASPDRQDPVWEGTELPFHRGKRRVRKKVYPVHDAEGRPSLQRAQAMRREQHRIFNVSLPDPEERNARGPIGDDSLSRGDIYPCEAPINDVLFRSIGAAGVQARRPDGDDSRGMVFEIVRAQDYTADETRHIPRIELLLGPDGQHLQLGLALSSAVMKRLGLK